jgi:DNA repair exonuclease SbcCD nuclease subunit
MSDLHLGYRQYGKFDRAIDFFNASMKAVELLIEQEPDFVLVPGDVFHRDKPFPVDQRHAIRVFKLLKDEGIPVFTIRGNHDASFTWSQRQGGNEIDVLDDLELVRYLEDDVQEHEIDGKGPVNVWGLGYHGDDAGEKLAELVEKNKSLLSNSEVPNVLMIHSFLSNWISSVQLSEYALDLYGFDYIGIGHHHGWWVNGSNSMCCSGSTEHVSTHEWDEPERSIALVTLSRFRKKWKPTIERFKYKVRPKIRRKIDLGSVTVDEVVEKLSDEIRLLDKDEVILQIDVSCILTDSQQTIDFGSIAKLASKAFHVSIHPELDFAGLPIREDISREEIMRDVFVERFDVPKSKANRWVELAEEMKSILTESLDDRGKTTLVDLLYSFNEPAKTRGGKK